MAAAVAPFEWHKGESAMREALKVPKGANPTVAGFPVARYGRRVTLCHLVALGTLDAQGRPWTTLWGGERGFARPAAEGVLAFTSRVDTANDPVFGALWKDTTRIERGGDVVVQPREGTRRPMACLTIDLESRDRVKAMGQMVAGAMLDGSEDVAQLIMGVEESIGNCPKYINTRALMHDVDMKPEIVHEGLPLSEAAVDLVKSVDMFFLSSTSGERMDTNHRGGGPGFVRIVRNDAGGTEIVYPEFSGNRLYQSLGNLKVNPLIGLAFPNYDTGDVLYVTGKATVLIGHEASSLLDRSRLAVSISVSSARLVKSGLSFRTATADASVVLSPYTPPVRRLVCEQSEAPDGDADHPKLSATLVRREEITPTVCRFTFKLRAAPGRDTPLWTAGQHVSFAFEDEVSAGYSHMRDDDPQSLNDDYVRTFTVSNPPPPLTTTTAGSADGQEMQITCRLHGPVTRFLFQVPLRAQPVIPVLGFGGHEDFHMPRDLNGGAPSPVFVAAGVGITPVLSQAGAVLAAGVPLSLLWSLRHEDLELARDTFARVEGLAARTTLFVTGWPAGVDPEAAATEAAERLGAEVEPRRIAREDMDTLRGVEGKEKRRFYLCTSPALLKMLVKWLEGEDVVWEDFGY